MPLDQLPWMHVDAEYMWILHGKLPIDGLVTQQGIQQSWVRLMKGCSATCNITPHVTAALAAEHCNQDRNCLSAATFFQSTPWPRDAEGDLHLPLLLAHAGWQQQEPSRLAADNKVAFSENNFSENKFSANSFSANSFSETTSVQNCLQPKLIRSACRLQPKQVMLQSCLLWNLIRCTIELQSKPVMSPKLFLIKLYKVPRLSIKASDFCKYVFSRNW